MSIYHKFWQVFICNLDYWFLGTSYFVYVDIHRMATEDVPCFLIRVLSLVIF
jgi:hypothetical protein